MQEWSFPAGFASDNNAGVHPEVLAAIASINKGHCLAYGHDAVTRAAEQAFQKLFGKPVEVFFVFNGTGANVLALSAMTKSYHAVICTQYAHLYVDECGAPEKFAHTKLLPLPTHNGKLTPEIVARALTGRGDEHRVQPRVVSLSQSTEVGTVYSIAETKSLVDFANKNGLYTHIDGARLANAVVAQNCSVAELTEGIDVVVFGGTKNGLLFGEALVFLNTALAHDFLYLRKQSMQLASKMRFIAVQFLALLENDLWRKNAQHANQMASHLAQALQRFPEIQLTQVPEANGVFATLPPEWIAPLQAQSFFYVWDEFKHEVRLMCSFDTQMKDIDNFILAIEKLSKKE